ncbi:hypothetical protein DL768_000801 [Monosporascus sp. mg162]|nr:hypothetical protein DL768_000801 [Monosporascus sp. mg162]
MFNTKTLNASPQVVYKILCNVFDFPDDDRRLWWHSTAPMFAEMPQTASDDMYTFEPLKATTGTDIDPFNAHATWVNLQELMTIQFATHPEYFHHFKRYLTFDAQESIFLHENSLAGGEIMAQNKLALGLKGNQFLIKAYLSYSKGDCYWRADLRIDIRLSQQTS